jgi:hypothetical protein
VVRAANKTPSAFTDREMPNADIPSNNADIVSNFCVSKVLSVSDDASAEIQLFI